MSKKPVYRINKGSIHEGFLSSRKKFQVFGGGFGNGKTASLCAKALGVCKDYPGANILLARSTYPKLNDTLRKEFFKWCPESWVKRRPTKDDNTCILHNGTTINFRYIAQHGKTQEDSSSNLLSATYDFIGVDQMEDAEITQKDFNDLVGRLRGATAYAGDDPTMPQTGPRWFVMTSNPTRNWFYKYIVKPVHDTAHGLLNPNLLVEPETGEPLVDLFEGPTSANQDNLPADFLTTMRATYRGQMFDRFFLGKWGAYEGLVFPTFNEQTHQLPHDVVHNYLQELRAAHIRVTFVEGYDDGLAVPSAYLFGFADHNGNVLLLDGCYATGEENTPQKIANYITDTRQRYGVPDSQGPVLADPSIFRRGRTQAKLVGQSVATMYEELGIWMVRGNADIENGIRKISSYLHTQKFHPHPITGDSPAPYIYFSDKLSFLADELNDYYWRKNTAGERIDEPVDRNDHAITALKYLLTHRPTLATLAVDEIPVTPAFMFWHEQEIANKQKAHRYGKKA